MAQAQSLDPVSRWQAAVEGPLRGEPDFQVHRATWDACFSTWPDQRGPPPAWVPDDATIVRANITALCKQKGFRDHDQAWRWSASDRDGFWQWALRRYGLTGLEPAREGGAEDPVWFPKGRWNAVAPCWRHDADKTAIVVGGEGRGIGRVSYGDLRAMADRVSRGLLRLGLSEGDAVALYMPMDVACCAAYLGIVQAGMAVVSIPDAFSADEVATRLRLGDAKAVVTVASFRRAGKTVRMLDRARAACDGRRLIVCGEADLAEGETSWDDLLDTGSGADQDRGKDRGTGLFGPVPVDPYHVSNVLFSSGTTGEPKAIPWTHLTPFKAATDGWLHQDIHEDDVVAWPTNIGWMMGPWLLYASLMNGATVALWEGAPNQQAFLGFCNEAEVTVLGVVPALVRAWRDAGTPLHHLRTVRVLSSTGEASNVDDYLWLMALASYRAPVIEYCGGTEVGGGHLTGTVVQPQSPAAFSTAAYGIVVVVLDAQGEPVPEGGMGEVFLVPPSVGLSQRLLNRDHHEEYYAGCPAGPDGAVLRRHGDEVERLWRGHFRAQGRADDTMNLGGIKVSSVELERAMDGAPGVRETAAVAVPLEGGGADRLVVFAVVQGDDADVATLRKDLQERIRSRLSPLYKIHDVVLVDALPRTASNKVMRRELRGQYRG